MTEYFIYYASINIVGAIIFGIMLMHDLSNIDKQEKQLKYDHVLLAFILYFISDSLWAGVDSKVFPVNEFTVVATAFSNFVVMTGIVYMWLRYVMAYEQIPNRNTWVSKITMFFPFFVSTIFLIITYIIAPRMLIDENLKNTKIFDVFMVSVPYIYIIAVIVYALKKAIHEENSMMKRKHLYIGFFPIMVVAGGLMQMILMPALPIFCFSSNIFMLIFYIHSMEDRISTDPLTMLNNRGQLAKYVSVSSNLRMEGRSTYCIMLDVNDFKFINDTYGHAEGDSALVIIAQALLKTIGNYNMPVFLGRYGGDEFVMIAHPLSEGEVQALVWDIRKNIEAKCEQEKKPYMLSVGVGVDKLEGEQDSFAKCIERADEKLYQNKEECKKKGQTTKSR